MRIDFGHGHSGAVGLGEKGDDGELGLLRGDPGLRVLGQRKSWGGLDVVIRQRVPVGFGEERGSGEKLCPADPFAAWAPGQLHLGQAQPVAHDRERTAEPGFFVQKGGVREEVTVLAIIARECFSAAEQAGIGGERSRGLAGEGKREGAGLKKKRGEATGGAATTSSGVGEENVGWQ